MILVCANCQAYVETEDETCDCPWCGADVGLGIIDFDPPAQKSFVLPATPRRYLLQ